MVLRQLSRLKDLRQTIQYKIGIRGATLVEYALIAAIIAVALTIIINSFGANVGKGFSSVGEVLNR